MLVTWHQANPGGERDELSLRFIFDNPNLKPTQMVIASENLAKMKTTLQEHKAL